MSLIKYVKGDLFHLTRTPTTEPILLAHACNCLGIWGGGIAFAFKQRFMSSYKLYHKYCSKFSSEPAQLLGTALLLPVSSKDRDYIEGISENLIIVCLFTSVMGQESPDEIAENTLRALLDLKKQLLDLDSIPNDTARLILENYRRKLDSQTEMMPTVNMPRINAGIFDVPWNLTEDAMKKTHMQFKVYTL